MRNEKLEIMEANFEWKGNIVHFTLDAIEEHQLENRGVKFLIGKLRRRCLTMLQLRGESVTLSELKFKGIKESV